MGAQASAQTQSRGTGLSDQNVKRLPRGEKPSKRECLNCGMHHQQPAPDIADRVSETVVQAVEKLELTLNKIWRQTHAQTLRLIVGGGLIRDAVLAELYFKKSRGTVLDFSEENRGSLIIRIR